jgi:hypothetical protein
MVVRWCSIFWNFLGHEWIWIGLGWCFWGDQIRWSYCQRRRGNLLYNHFVAIDDAIFNFFQFWAQSIYIKPCFLNPPNLMTPPHDPPPNPIFATLHSKSVRSCVENQTFGSEVGEHLGWGRNGHAFHAHPLLFQPLFILETINLTTRVAFYWVTRRRPIAKHNPLKFSLHFISILSPNAKCI